MRLTSNRIDRIGNLVLAEAEAGAEAETEYGKFSHECFD